MALKSVELHMFKADSCRVVIIGAGRVGSHCAMSLIPGRLADEVVLIDKNEALAQAQANDLADFATGMGSAVSVRAGEYADCDSASFVLVTAGRGRRPGETRLELLHDTLDVLRDISDKLSATSFDGLLVCVTNPVDIATEYLSRRLGLPSSQVLGTGTSLDTIRLRRLLCMRTGVDVGQIQGFCLGEHGDSSFVSWSHVSLGGVPLQEYLRVRTDLAQRLDRSEIQRLVHTAGGSIISGKGCTEFGVGSVVTDVISAVSRGETKILPLSVHLNGEYGQRGICAGTPCVIGAGGVEQVLELELPAGETLLMEASCAVIRGRLEEVL